MCHCWGVEFQIFPGSGLPWILLVAVLQRLLLMEKLGAAIFVNKPASSSFSLALSSCYRIKLGLLPLVGLQRWEIDSI
jgi:hypothetical protein